MSVFRVLIVEDNPDRERLLRAWLFPLGVYTVVARSAGQASGVLERDRGEVYGGILLDHDLRDRARTDIDWRLSGAEVVDAVVRYTSPDVPVLVHSMNLGEAPAMVDRLRGAGFDVTRIPMRDLTREQLTDWIHAIRDAADA